MDFIAGETIQCGEFVYQGPDGKLLKAVEPPLFVSPCDISRDDIITLTKRFGFADMWAINGVPID